MVFTLSDLNLATMVPTLVTSGLDYCKTALEECPEIAMSAEYSDLSESLGHCSQAGGQKDRECGAAH